MSRPDDTPRAGGRLPGEDGDSLGGGMLDPSPGIRRGGRIPALVRTPRGAIWFARHARLLRPSPESSTPRQVTLQVICGRQDPKRRRDAKDGLRPAGSGSERSRRHAQGDAACSAAASQRTNFVTNDGDTSRPRWRAPKRLDVSAATSASYRRRDDERSPTAVSPANRSSTRCRATSSVASRRLWRGRQPPCRQPRARLRRRQRVPGEVEPLRGRLRELHRRAGRPASTTPSVPQRS